MTPKPDVRLAAAASPTAVAVAKAAARIPTSNRHVDRCGWSRIDTLSLVTTSPCMRDVAGDDEGEEQDEEEDGWGGRTGRRSGRQSGRGGMEESDGIFLTQLPPELWRDGNEVGME